MKEFLTGLGIAILILASGLFGEWTGKHAERLEWIATRHRVTAGKCEQWHAPERPDTAGWWEACK